MPGDEPRCVMCQTYCYCGIGSRCQAERHDPKRIGWRAELDGPPDGFFDMPRIRRDDWVAVYAETEGEVRAAMNRLTNAHRPATPFEGKPTTHVIALIVHPGAITVWGRGAEVVRDVS